MFDLRGTSGTHAEFSSEGSEVDGDLLFSMLDARCEELLSADLGFGSFGRHFENVSRLSREDAVDTGESRA